MEKSTASKRAVHISDDAVRAKTGKTWDEWFKLLDAAGAKTLGHTAIAAYVHKKLGCPSWWCQMVTVGYEQERDLRAKHQRPEGYQISVSKTMEVPVGAAYKAWEDSKLRRRWLPDAKLTVRKATRAKSMRITWGDGATSVEAVFYSKGAARCQVVAQHSKLKNARDAQRMKTYWAEALARLKEQLER